MKSNNSSFGTLTGIALKLHKAPRLNLDAINAKMPALFRNNGMEEFRKVSWVERLSELIV